MALPGGGQRVYPLSEYSWIDGMAVMARLFEKMKTATETQKIFIEIE